MAPEARSSPSAVVTAWRGPPTICAIPSCVRGNECCPDFRTTSISHRASRCRSLSGSERVHHAHDPAIRQEDGGDALTRSDQRVAGGNLHHPCVG